DRLCAEWLQENRELPDRDNSAYNCAARLSHSGVLDFPEAIQRTCDRSGRRIYFAVARAARRLVSVVVVKANEVSIPLDHPDRVRDQSYSRSWNGARQARSSILADAACDNRDLRRMEHAGRTRRFCRY